MPKYLIRIGPLAELYVGESENSLQRGFRVLVRTELGVQVGETLGPCSDAVSDDFPGARATVLRATSDEDEWLIQRLSHQKREAVESCRQQLREAGSTSTLMDVDHLFDGGTLVMHFLGPVDDIAHEITSAVARKYESIVRTEEFARLLSEGCGPGCGTEDSAGCSSTCAGCAIKCH